MKIEAIPNGLKITTEEKENYTIVELEQKLINFLYENVGNLEDYKNEIELLDLIGK